MAFSQTGAILSLHQRPLVLHIKFPDQLMSAINNQGKADRGADIHIFKAGRHGACAVLDKKGIDDNDGQPEFGGSELQVADLKFVSCCKGEERSHFEAGKYRQCEQYLVSRSFRKNERITDYDRTKKEVIQQMIHVVAPPGQACVSIFTDLSVVMIGDVLQENAG